MSLHKDTQENIKEAMRAQEPVRLSVMRGLIAAFVNELVAKGRKPTEELTDEEALTVIRRGVKQRKESIEQFTRGNRSDLAAREEAELKILETYLPTMMAREDIQKIASAKKKELGVVDKSGAGKLMSALMSELKNRANGNDVKAVVDSLFA
jgi:uncharacterized protein YqeY